MTFPPARVAILAIAALSLGGCGLTIPATPGQYASLSLTVPDGEAPPADAALPGTVAGELPPEQATGSDEADGTGAQPLDVLARSERVTARWMREPRSRWSSAATLPATSGTRPVGMDISRPADTRNTPVQQQW